MIINTNIYNIINSIKFPLGILIKRKCHKQFAAIFLYTINRLARSFVKSLIDQNRPINLSECVHLIATNIS